MEDIDCCNKTSMKDEIESSRLDISKFWPNSYPADNLTKIDFIIFTKDKIDW